MQPLEVIQLRVQICGFPLAAEVRACYGGPLVGQLLVVAESLGEGARQLGVLTLDQSMD